MVEDKDTDLLEKEVEVYENVEKKPSKNVKLIKEVAQQEENRAGKHDIYKKESFKAIPKGQNGEFKNNDDPQFHDTTDFLKNVKENTCINKKEAPCAQHSGFALDKLMRRKSLPFSGASEAFYRKQYHLGEQTDDDVHCGAYFEVTADADTTDVHSHEKIIKDIGKAADVVKPNIFSPQHLTTSEKKSCMKDIPTKFQIKVKRKTSVVCL